MYGQTVYIDLTLITNLGADFLLLYFTAILSGKKIRWERLLLSAGMGAVFALFFVLYPDSLWLSPPFRVLFPMLMVYLAFAPFSGREFWRAIGFFYLLAFLVGGTAYALTNLGWAPLSFKALPWALLGACMLTAIAHHWLTHKTLASRQICSLELTLGEQQVKGSGFVDTGNSLCDPLTGKPVIVADLKWISPFLPPEVVSLVQQREWNSVLGAEILAQSRLAGRCRLLPFHSIGEANGLILTVNFDQAQIVFQNQTRIHNQVLVALAADGLNQDDSFQALIPAALT